MEIGGYRDLEEIGRGGYAVVYRGYQIAFGRTVAIKVLTNVGNDALERSRFEREALAMGQLSWHPNIVVVHDTGVTDVGNPYLVEEFLENGSLGDRLRRDGVLPPDEAVRHLIGLSAAAHTAHEAGLLHRDIKPDNALVDAFGRVKLADFGIAAITGSTLTATGMVTATVAHAAPEVLNGQRATPAADVYSLGSTLYELLTGAPAFTRDSDESIVPLVLRVTSDPVPDLRAGGLPDDLARVVERAMAKEPTDRPATALDLGRMLQGVQPALGSPVTEMAVRGGAPPPSEPTLMGQTPVPDPTPVPEVVPAPAPATTSPDSPVAALSGHATAPVPSPLVTPPPGPPPAPAPEERSKAPWVVVLVVLVVGAVVAALLLGGGDDGGGGGSGEDVSGAGPGGTDVPETQAIPVGGRPFRLTVSAEAVWVTQSDASSVSLIDPSSNMVTASVPVDGEPVGVATTDGAVWVAVFETDTLLRIDASTHEVTDTIPVGDGPRNVAASGSSVWVPNLNDDTVSRVNATTRSASTIPVGDGPRGVLATDRSVWVTNYEAGTVTRIDPATSRVVATVTVGGHPIGAVLAAGLVWVSEPESDSVISIDPGSNTVTGNVQLGAGHDPGGIAAEGTTIWVASSGTNQVAEIDASTGEIVEDFDVGDEPAGVAVHGRTVWVANTADDTVTRLTPR